MGAGYVTGSDFIIRRYQGETLTIEAWGEDCIRVRATLNRDLLPYDWAIGPKAPTAVARVTREASEVRLACGRLAVVVPLEGVDGPIGVESPLRFCDARSGKTLLTERQSRRTLPDPGRLLKAVGPSSFLAEARFEADPDEKFYGLGQNQNGFLNQKGCALELRQMNTHTTVPVMYSSKGYGFFWNNPAYGRVELARNGTYWIAEQTDQIDYFVFYGDTPAQVAGAYARLTGFPSMMPEWAMGFWQSKLRYRSQEELLQVAREHKRRGLPLSIIVVDFFHWSMMGEWNFDPRCWPDPEGMIRELKSLGVETMVSIWPTVNGNAGRFQEMLDRGYLVRAESGLPVFMRFTDTYSKSEYLHFVDFTNDEGGRYVWEIIRQNYYQRGVRLFWLDEAEPELHPYDTHNLRYSAGNGAKVSSLYPLFEAKTFYEGLTASGEQLPISLCRSAWAGSQRYGACVWSGDIFSTFPTLQAQIKNGLNMAMAGIPWWTTDIGGFFGGDGKDGEFRELIVRWFQFGVFCPVFRLHGSRNSFDPKRGGDNEVWSFGEEAYQIIKGLLELRERLRPYIARQMRTAHETGVPPMRPLFFDFPHDSECYEVEDEFLFGPDILVAPVAEYRRRSRSVYLPAGAAWVDAWTGSPAEGGSRIEAEAPLERIPVYLKDGAAIPIRRE